MPWCQRASVFRGLVIASEKAARNFLAKEGYGKVDDPVEALAELGGEAIAMKNFFRAQIEELRYKAQTGEQLRAEVSLYERAMDRTAKILEMLAKLGISERRTQIAESQAVLLAEVIRNVLDSLDLTPSQKVIASTVVPQELRAITAAPAVIAEPEGEFA